jgi:hypothetical protein
MQSPAFAAYMTSCVQSNCTIRETLSKCRTINYSTYPLTDLATKNFTETIRQEPVRDHTDMVTYSGIIGGSLALFAVLLRIAARLPCLGGAWGADDWVILIAIVSCFGGPIFFFTKLTLVRFLQ